MSTKKAPCQHMHLIHIQENYRRELYFYMLVILPFHIIYNLLFSDIAPTLKCNYVLPLLFEFCDFPSLIHKSMRFCCCTLFDLCIVRSKTLKGEVEHK
jgi:hypothetical protein